MTRRILLLVPLLAAAADTGPASVQYDVTINGTALAVIARQGPEGLDAEVETRPREASAVLTVTTADTAGGRSLSVRADTVIVPAPPAPPGAELRGHENATGATWHGLLPTEPGALSLAAAGPASARLLDEPVLFLMPRLPAGLRAGSTWSDTSRFAVEAERARASGVIFSDYRVVGGDARGGWQLERSFRGDRTQRTQSPNGEVLLEAQSQGTAGYVLDPAGAVASLRIVRTQQSTMHIPQFDAPLSAETGDTIQISRR